MKENTYLFHSINIAENKAQYDTEVKKILSDKGVLSWILKYTVEEFKQMELSEIKNCIEGEPEIMTIPVYPGEKPQKSDSSKESPAITGMKNEDDIPNEGKILYDIRFHAIAPIKKRIKLIINVEAQKDYYPGYDLVTRALFYCARMLSAQLDTEFTTDNYNEIKKVYSIWICMDSPLYAENTITEYKIEQKKIYGDFPKTPRYDLLSAVMICLSKTDSSKGNSLHKLLSTLLSNQIAVEEKARILIDEYGLEMTKTIKEGMVKMCNLSDLIEEQGIRQGIKQGIEQGMEQGLICAASMLQKLGYSDIGIVNQIADNYKISEKQVKEILFKAGILD